MGLTDSWKGRKPGEINNQGEDWGKCPGWRTAGFGFRMVS